MRLRRCVAMRVGTIMATLELVLGLAVGFLFTSVATSKAKLAVRPTAENALAAEQEITGHGK